MPSAPILIGLGFVIVTCAIAAAVWPLLRDDMNRSVVANDNRPDVTSMALLALGSGLVAGIPAVGLLQRVSA